MLKIGITGQAGFIGTHLYHTLGLYPGKFARIRFDDAYFQSEAALQDFVRRCDVVVHLAAMNRHNDPEIIYQTNIRLVAQLIAACEATQSTPHILFSSSTQEERSNLYGQSKKDGRMMLKDWAARNGARFSGFIIPNVFGPFGNPYYNSVVATFCYQLTHDEIPVIDVDSTIRLIYVGQLVRLLIDHIEQDNSSSQIVAVIKEVLVSPTSELNVSDLLSLLSSYKELYFRRGEVPALDTEFNRDLFNTFLSYIDHTTFFPFALKLNSDSRGSFVETAKLNSGGQVSFSTTVPGITRGNHFHTRKAERFAVIQGQARIELRRIGTERVMAFELDGSNPSFVDMPVWYTHNITNTGEGDLLTIFWISEHYDANDPDTFFETV
jgi:UDP-2-acetamido-2,6-beta-L-arabino-hexul-4-ose reductase